MTEAVPPKVARGAGLTHARATVGAARAPLPLADAVLAWHVGGTILDSFTKDEYCDVDEPTAACVARAGAADFILLGKVPAQGACPEEGVAQLINDHTALKMSGACVEIDQ